MALSSRMSLVTSSSHAAIIKSLCNRYHETDNPAGFVNLAVAENTLMHDELLTYINQHVRHNSGIFMYGNGGAGSERLRSSMASFMNAHFHPAEPLRSASILCTNGMTNAIEGLAFALADKGDAFLLARPHYGSFPHVLRDRSGVETICVSFGQDIDPFSLEAIDAYESALTEAQASGVSVRAIILCNPHNPLGYAYSREYLVMLMRFAARYGLHIISDEIYALSSWTSPACCKDMTPFTSILAVDPQDIIDPSYVHCLWGMSKDFGASGFRIAAIASPHNEQLLNCLATRGMFTFPSGPTDAIVAQILEDDVFCDQYLAQSSVKLSNAYKFATDFLKQHKITYATPGGSAIFLWVDLGSKLASIMVERAMKATKIEQDDDHEPLSRRDSAQKAIVNAEIEARLVKHKIYLANGDAFGSEHAGWFRIVFSHDRNFVRTGLERMIEALEDEEFSVDGLCLPAAHCICV